MIRRDSITPIGGALIAICFFLPWVRISCMGSSSYSGASFGGVYWVIFASGLLIAGYFLLPGKWRKLPSRKLLSVLTTICAGVLAYGCLTMAGGKRILLVRIGPEDVNLRLQSGAFGTLLGFILAWAGIVKLRVRSIGRHPACDQNAANTNQIADTEVDATHTSA